MRRAHQGRARCFPVRTAHPTSSQSALSSARLALCGPVRQAVRRPQSCLQPGDELVRLCFAAKTHTVLIQANLPQAFAALTLCLDDNLHTDHLLGAAASRRRYLGSVRIVRLRDPFLIWVK